MARYDAARTAMATGTSNITDPVAYWRYYLGGSLDRLVSIDVDGDDADEFLFVAGGRVFVKEASDELVWQSAPLGIYGLGGIADLDGDDQVDIVAYSANRVYVFSAIDGAVEWAGLEEGDIAVGIVRIGDLDGDNLAEVVIGDCDNCCFAPGRFPGLVFSFADGFSSAHVLWELPSLSWCGVDRSLTLANLDGDGALEVLLVSYGLFQVLDGATGDVLASLEALGARAVISRCRVVDVDDDPSDELVCILDADNVDAPDRRVFLLEYEGGVTPELSFGWSHTLAPIVDGDVQWGDPVADADGDGILEVLVSAEVAGESTTYVFDAESGEELGTLADHQARGVISGTDGVPLVVTASGSAVYGSVFVRGEDPALTVAWALPGVDVITYGDQSLLSRSGLITRLLTADVDGDGQADLLTRELSTSAPIIAYAPDSSAADEIARSESLQIRSAWPGVSGGLDQFVVARGDGVLATLGADLEATGEGIRFGGFYTGAGTDVLGLTAVSGALGGDGDSILVVGSDDMLRRLDAFAASWASPPLEEWSLPRTFSPAIVPGLNGGEPGIACGRIAGASVAEPEYQVQALRADGSEIWSHDVENVINHDVVPGTFDSDGVPDLVFGWGDLSDARARARAVSGANGFEVWETTIESDYLIRGLSVGPFDSDDLDDVYFQAVTTRAVSGEDGEELAAGGAGSYFLPTLYDVDGDGTNEVTLHGGFDPAHTLSSDLSESVWVGEDDRPLQYGAVAVCEGHAPVLAEASEKYPGRLKFTIMGGPDAGDSESIVLSSGRLYPNESEVARAGLLLARLTSATTHTNLTGAGRPSVLVGSLEGWLYAINPCTLTLDFAVEFEGAVSEAVYADTDGNGLDEILVSVSDGYLYGIKDKAIEAPEFVYDTDPASGSDDDVDVVDPTSTSLSARWSSSPGAIGYEVAVLDGEGLFVTEPQWQSVEITTNTTLTDLELEEGKEYFFVVRAISAAGPSVDVLSDGVTLREIPLDGGVDGGDAGEPDAGEDAALPDAHADADVRVSIGGGGCGCSIASPGRAWSPLCAGGVLFAAAWRRRRRGSRG